MAVLPDIIPNTIGGTVYDATIERAANPIIEVIIREYWPTTTKTTNLHLGA